MANLNFKAILDFKLKGDKALKGVSKQFDTLNEKSKALSKTLGAAGQLFSFAAITVGASKALQAYDRQDKALKKVQARLKAVGDTAGVTFKELTDEASKLQGISLFGDEDILTDVTQQLLTFKNISGDVFKETQKLALDLTTVLDGDLKSTSIQLGKALNDPVLGLTALSRSGIQFSKDQKEVIKTLVETGRQTEAQNIILKELKDQYGGAAEAAAQAGLGGFQQFRNILGDLNEFIGSIIAPALLGFTKLFTSLPSGVQKGIAAFTALSVVVGGLTVSLGSLKAALIGTGIGALVVAVGTLINALFQARAATDSWANAFSLLGKRIELFLLEAYESITSFDFASAFDGIRAGVVNAFVAAWNFLRANLGKFLDFIGLGIASAEASEIKLDIDTETVSDKIARVKREIEELTTRGAVGGAGVKIPIEPEIVTPNPAEVTNQIKTFSNNIKSAIEQGNFKINLLQSDPNLTRQQVQDQSAIILDGVRQTVEAQRGLLNDYAENARNLTATQLQSINQINTQATAFVQANTQRSLGFIDQLRNNLRSVEQSFAQIASQGVQNFASGLTDALSSIADGTKSASEAFSDFASSFLKNIAKMITESLILRAINQSLGVTPSTARAGGGLIGDVQRFNSGGQVRDLSRNGTGGLKLVGPGGDTDDKIPALLSNGEVVLRSKAVRSLVKTFGQNIIPKLNFFDKRKSDLPQFNSGGLVNLKGFDTSNVIKLNVPKFRDGGEVSSNGGINNITNNQMGPMQVAVNLRNEGGQPVSASQGSAQFDGEKLIVDVVLQQLSDGGPISDGIQSTFGVRRTGSL